ncbi:hypothetical protein E8E11_000144 [Didymella keratinophila]|nr:hypothetical protein E8E11_000144 [Didymella keratinophila]
MRLSIIVSVVMPVMISTVTVGKNKKSPCDSCTDGYNTCMDNCGDHEGLCQCKVACDCQQGKDATCSACGYGNNNNTCGTWAPTW